MIIFIIEHYIRTLYSLRSINYMIIHLFYTIDGISRYGIVKLLRHNITYIDSYKERKK
jgi:hypothetical protein